MFTDIGYKALPNGCQSAVHELHMLSEGGKANRHSRGSG